MSPPASVTSAIIFCSLCLLAQPVQAICPSGPFDLSNVTWIFADSLATCPGGDSLVFTHSSLHKHPSRLRILVGYFDEDCDPRVGVRPESLWVTLSNFTSTLQVNDEGAVTYADDSTDTGGGTRITVPSFSGCGTARVTLYVSGVSQGFKTVHVRSVDTNGDGRVTSADESSPCDVNYNTTTDDAALVSAHAEHWHHNALHGTLVRRTNFCETCALEAANTKGEGQVFWSPSRKYISFTAFVSAYPDSPACKVFIVPSDPVAGNSKTQVTFSPAKYHDYDPSWSPLNTQIVFDRADSALVSVDVPWLGNTETVISASTCGPTRIGDDYPSISPNGQWIAFSRCNPVPPDGRGGWSLWKVPIDGGEATQLTDSTGATDIYASWAPGGELIYFQHQAVGNDQITLWRISPGGGTAEEVFDPPSSPNLFDAVQPAISPDGGMLVMGYGKRDLLVRNVTTHTLDPALASASADAVIGNYPDTTFAAKGTFPILSPRLSPDGTRLALGSKQVWAARQNMNLPPAFTTCHASENGTISLVDTTATVNIDFDYTSDNDVTVSATDPEGDALTYYASFFPDAWMDWHPTTRTLSGDPPLGTLGKTFFVKFWVTTPSGGTDSFIGIITVSNTLARSAELAASQRSFSRGPNPTKGTFAVAAPIDPRIVARLKIFDLTGRLVAVVDQSRGGQLVWEGRDRSGALAPSGVYLWRLDAARETREGRVVIVR